MHLDALKMENEGKNHFRMYIFFYNKILLCMFKHLNTFLNLIFESSYLAGFFPNVHISTQWRQICNNINKKLSFNSNI